MRPAEIHYLKYRPLYEEAIKTFVCEHCIDHGADGVCHSKDPQSCAVFRYLKDLVEIAFELHERKVEPYAQAVRQRLCLTCKNSSADGEKCGVRECLDCALDRYLPLVLEAIEKVQSTLAASKN
ncbi:MAG: hypothetical protein HYZ87_05000 [Candidatus Omnitrophica bacterium]|nr:hypothetical protein [Candidatus Omnitrophota bacterium]